MSRPLSPMNKATPFSLPPLRTPEDRPYLQPRPSYSRSPCPALNTLANHGYIHRNGKDVGFFELVRALQHVYNITWFFAFFLTLFGYAISGKVTFYRGKRHPSQPNTWLTWALMLVPMPRWTLDLASLSLRGFFKIAHEGALVHKNYVISHSPDQTLVDKISSYASCHGNSKRPGLTLSDVAHYHKERVDELKSPLNFFHRKVALGECGLAWAVMRDRRPSLERQGTGDSTEEVITEEMIETWFGCERLPSDWWADGGSRPVEPVGLWEAKSRANEVAKIIRNDTTQ